MRGSNEISKHVVLLNSLFCFATIICCLNLVRCSPEPRHRSVIFIGSSTVQRWAGYTDFPSRNWIARGIPGQTSPQVLARFDNDVLGEHPYAVHILCGINDMSPGYVPDTLVANWAEMISRAKGAGLQVYIGTLQPWGTGPSMGATRNTNVTIANARLKEITASLGATVIDYHDVLVGPDGFFDPSLTDDGIHPNELGFQRMTRLAEDVLQPFRTQ